MNRIGPKPFRQYNDFIFGIITASSNGLDLFFSSYVHMDKLMHKMWVDDEYGISTTLESELEAGIENFRIALNQLNLQ